MITEASVGFSRAALERYGTASFAGQAAAHGVPTPHLDPLSSELQVSDSLKNSGVHSLLGIRLPSHQKRIRVLYVGLAETRPFSVRELRRIEALADQLALHLCNAELCRDLQEKIDELNQEQELREHFMSLLAHDLRGPLNVAKMAASVLMSHPEKLDARRELAIRIDTSIGRVDRMIKDLLDVNSIRANKRLSLRLDESDLVELARELIDELSLIHGQRFILKADNEVRGIWSDDELRRALWNLAINAVKYGSPDTPITITVKRSDSYAQASVHNFGSALTAEEQSHLFEPFGRTPQAQRSDQTGWGLGLTLVRGCAEAHGGTVTIESQADLGTTFTLQLPLDSRPYQPH
jgi:signal transduction histidine kinase